MSPRPIELPESEFDGPLHLAREGRWDEAIAALERASRERRGRSTRAAVVSALTRVARIAAGAGGPDSAERAVDAALRLAPEFADLHYHKACLLLARQRRVEARRSLEAALKINSGYVAARLEMALLDAHEGLVGESLRTLRSLALQCRVSEPRMFQEGLENLEHAEIEAAASLLRRALQISDPRLEQQLEQFHTLIEGGEMARAAQVLRDAIESHPGYPDLHLALGSTELQLGRCDDALASLGQALELKPDYHAARILFARALESMGEKAQALEQLGLVLEHEPENAQASELVERWSARGRHVRTAKSAAPKRP